MIPAAFLAIAGAFFGFANPLYRLPILALFLPTGVAAAALYAPSNARAWRIGYIIGVLSALGPLYWTALPIHDYGGLSWYLALPVPVLMALVLGLYPALVAVLARFAARRLHPLVFGLFFAILWTTMEMARGTLLTGFPWLTLASALSPWPTAIQATAYVGAYGLSGVLAGAGALLAALRPSSMLLGAAVLAGLWFFGNHRLYEPPPLTGTAKVALIQGNVDQSVKWAPENQKATLDKYMALSRAEIEQRRPDILVWPETALPFYVQDPIPPSRAVADFVRQTGVPLLTGTPAYKRIGPESAILFNRAVLVDPSGLASGHYDKEHLVPFGEYVPLGRYLPFIGKLVEGVGDFAPGDSSDPIVSGNLAMGLLICYESIFPELAQKRVEAGANVLVNLSNDAWFGDSPAPRQHLDLAVLRAVEQGRFLIRATNTGISAYIDAHGRITARGGLFAPLALAYPDVALTAETTWFHRHYGFFAPMAVILVVAALTGCCFLPPRSTTTRGRRLKPL